MSKIELATVNTPLNSHEFHDQINRNFEKVSEALDNQLQRTAQEDVVNYMEQELNMGGNRIINLAKAVDPSDAMRKKEFDEKIANIEQWAQEARDSAASAAEDADDAEEARRVAVSAAQSAQEHERQTQDLFDVLMSDDSIPVVAENIADVKTVATDIDSVKTNADNIEDIKAVFDIAKRIAYGNIGDIRATFAAAAPEGCRFTDGSIVRKEDYPELFEMLDRGDIPFDSVSVWTSNVNTHGITGAFGYDIGSSEAYLPLLTEAFVEATNNTPNRVNDAGLPNITDDIFFIDHFRNQSYVDSANGLLQYTGTVTRDSRWQLDAYDSTSTWRQYAFNASNVNSLYGNSDTVQPKSIMLRHYVVLTNSRQMILTMRTSVATKNALPTTGNINGDIRVVIDEGKAYVWARASGTQWVWSSIGRVGTSGSSGFAEWGSIEGDIYQQADLQEALAGKADVADLTGCLKNRASDSGGKAIAISATDLGASATGSHSIAIGSEYSAQRRGATASGGSSIAIGTYQTEASGTQCIAIGLNAKATAEKAIQIGNGTNNQADTFQVRSYQLLDANGQIPAERLTNVLGDIETLLAAL